MNEHINAINELMDRIRLSGYSSKGKMLTLDPNWLEIKEHLVELQMEISSDDKM